MANVIDGEVEIVEVVCRDVRIGLVVFKEVEGCKYGC